MTKKGQAEVNNEQKAEQLRRNFRHLDDNVLVGFEQVAALLNKSLVGAYAMRAKGQLPPPVLNSGRNVRWSAGQLRQWVSKLASEVEQLDGQPLQLNSGQDANAQSAARIGRPRKDVNQMPGYSNSKTNRN